LFGRGRKTSEDVPGRIATEIHLIASAKRGYHGILKCKWKIGYKDQGGLPEILGTGELTW
jgi:hypothetical protein